MPKRYLPPFIARDAFQVAHPKTTRLDDLRQSSHFQRRAGSDSPQLRARQSLRKQRLGRQNRKTTWLGIHFTKTRQTKKALNWTCPNTVRPWQQCVAACKGDQRCESKCYHRFRNINKRCPRKKPATGKPDLMGNTWEDDTLFAETFFHGSNDCFRSGHFQCCYDCNGDVVTTGPFQGTFDFVPPGDPLGHLIHDVWPHQDDDGYYDNLTTTY